MTTPELVEKIVRTLVDAPEAVVVDVLVAAERTVLRVCVAPADLGTVIGRDGRMAQSLRTVMCAVAKKEGRAYSLDIVETDASSRGL